MAARPVSGGRRVVHARAALVQAYPRLVPAVLVLAALAALLCVPQVRHALLHLILVRGPQMVADFFAAAAALFEDLGTGLLDLLDLLS